MKLINILEDKLNDEYYGKSFEIEGCEYYTIEGISVSNASPYARVNVEIEIEIDFGITRTISPTIELELNGEGIIGEFKEQVCAEVVKYIGIQEEK